MYTRKNINILSNDLLSPASKSNIYEFDWDEETADTSNINQVGNNIFSCFPSNLFFLLIQAVIKFLNDDNTTSTEILHYAPDDYGLEVKTEKFIMPNSSVDMSDENNKNLVSSFKEMVWKIISFFNVIIFFTIRL